jgi:hypothetical protein
MSTECVQGIVIDICSKTFMLISDEGNQKTVECDNTEEFMNVLEVVTSNLDPEQIEYAELAVYGNTND